ncbi:MAG: SDR family oxidoreductase [Verrucomicrobia bacterium]|nr:SDR family oxidoreductase [Verrucomicrobiota bacterium]
MNPWHSLAGRTILVTGGAGYLGSAVTEELDRSAGKVLCLDLPGKAAAFVRERGLRNTLAYDVDLTDVAGLTPALDALMNEHGVPDGVVHFAFASSAGKTVEELLPSDLDSTFCRALTPAFLLTRHVAERMRSRGSGSIVLYGSMYGMVSPDPRIYHLPMKPNPIDYGASKAAVIQMTKYFAVHYGASGIRVNCVTPGPFPNPNVQRAHPGLIADLSAKTALRRIGVNSEIVGPTLFLLGDGASYVTGQSLVVDGGWTVW